MFTISKCAPRTEYSQPCQFSLFLPQQLEHCSTIDPKGQVQKEPSFAKRNACKIFKKLSFTQIRGIESSLIRIKFKIWTEMWNYLTFSLSKTDLFCLASSLLNTTHFSNQKITEKTNQSENIRHSCCLQGYDVFEVIDFQERQAVKNQIDSVL